MRVWNDGDLEELEKMITSYKNKDAKPPPEVAGHLWSMLDSGSEPTVADCEVSFPDHQIRESAGQKQGVQYKSASGQLIANEGEVEVVHQDPNGGRYSFTFQHAKVHCPIVSVTQLIHKGCEVTFHKNGGPHLISRWLSNQVRQARWCVLCPAAN